MLPLPIRLTGDPVLTQMALSVTNEELRSDSVQQLIDQMLATLKKSGGIGLAAPQVGSRLRIVVLAEPLTVLVNPVLTPVGSEQQASAEQCLSVPGLEGVVQRHRTVRIQALGRTGKQIDQQWTNLRAAVVQHEVDHLDGILYTQRTEAVTSVAHEPAPITTIDGQQTIVVDSEMPVGGSQFVQWQFARRGRVVAVRLQPGGALVTAAWLSGVRLRRAGYRAGAASQHLLGGRPLHVAAGDQLRLELKIVGKKRIVAEVDVDWAAEQQAS